MSKSAIALALILTIVPIRARAQNETVAQLTEQARALQSRPEVAAALDYIDKNRESILREWTTITEINAPSGQEKERARYIEKLLKKMSLKQIHYDGAGNLIATRKGTGNGPVVVFDAHMDTVFQPGLKIKATVSDGKIFAPGVGDDTRNIEALLASIRALNAAHVKTKGDLIFVFTVDEEKTMSGAKAFTKENKGKVNYYVALDGGYEGFTYAGIGINWYRYHFIGPGGHTRSETPPYSATLPLARAIERIYQLQVPKNPSSNLNIGMLGGSEVVNAKASDAWFSLDLRSTDNGVIADLKKKVDDIVKEEADRARMTFRTDVISESPAATIPGHRNSYMVRMAEAVYLAMGFENPPITNTGSNNASAALREGIPAISTGAGPCGDAHALTEWCYIDPFYRGIKKTIMLELALAEVSN
ncbi:MAG: M20/M25/M40 family metallo-hydrolase [Acidobacteriota bacterium]|nr:M20/M25/M40 family metallo-hydrolase [Acidobacteriota bacterium]